MGIYRLSFLKGDFLMRILGCLFLKVISSCVFIGYLFLKVIILMCIFRLCILKGDYPHVYF